MKPAALALLWLVAATLAHSQTRSAAEVEAERKLREVRGEIRKVGAERERIGGERVDAAQALKAADAQLAASTRRVEATTRQLLEERRKLDELEARAERQARQLKGQREVLARLVRASYMSGRTAPLQALLSQDRVAAAQRDAAAYAVLERDRSARIRDIALQVQTLRASRAAAQQQQLALASTSKRLQAQREALARDRATRAALLSQLDVKYQAHVQREKSLDADARALEAVLANLRAAAARAERERRAAAERERREQARETARLALAHAKAVRAAKSRGLPPPPEQTSTPRPRTQASLGTTPVGGAGWPVSGTLLTGFGGRFPDGASCSGYLIGAPAGTPVLAVADGKVVFAEWMNGYGLISIVDHGNGYMSLYAHNASLLRDVGAQVHRGEALASVGNSGGAPQPAVYFELRRNGQPVNPATWLQRR